MILKSVKEAISLEKSNGNTLWWKAISQDMKKGLIYVELYEGNVEDIPPGYQEVSCHIICYVKMVDHFFR